MRSSACSGYSAVKITENIDCEIFGVVLEEARESYEGEGVVMPLQSDTAEEMERNVETLRAWFAQRTGGSAPAA
jgi:adenylate kinase